MLDVIFFDLQIYIFSQKEDCHLISEVIIHYENFRIFILVYICITFNVKRHFSF
jgi:hypothetical protein